MTTDTKKSRAPAPATLLSLEKRIASLEVFARQNTVAAVKEMHSRAIVSGRAMQLMIERTVVVSEVCHFARRERGLTAAQREQIRDAALKVLDLFDDEWEPLYRRYSACSVAQWAHVLLRNKTAIIEGDLEKYTGENRG